jgi:hypothetical protein
MAHLISVDPGLTTGVALFTDGEVQSWQSDDPMKTLYYIEGSLREFKKPDAIICEAYLITNDTIKKSRQNWSLELIGALRFMAWKDSIPFILQTPSEALHFVKSGDNDEFGKLKRLGWYVTNNQGNHQNAARSHLLLYAVNNKIVDPRLLLGE